MKAYLVSHDSNKDVFGIKIFTLYLALDWILYLVIILLIDYGIMLKTINYIKAIWTGKIDKNFQEDSDVYNERQRVENSRGKRGIKLYKNFVLINSIDFK